MAPGRDSSRKVLAVKGETDHQTDDHQKDKAAQNLWASLLVEVQANTGSKLPGGKTILVLGDYDSGKTSLVAKLRGSDKPIKGSGLTYHSIFVRDEYCDDHTRLGVYTMEGDPSHAHSLTFALSEKKLLQAAVNGHHQLPVSMTASVSNSSSNAANASVDPVILLCAAMTQPWNILDSLHTWVDILQGYIRALNLPADNSKERQHKCVKRWLDYVEPGDELDGTSNLLRRTGGSSTNEEDGQQTLPDNVLTCNLGLDIIVVITKTDYMVDLEKEYDYKEEHFDFIQQAIRKFCLQYGASLCYTSVKEDKNTHLLLKYLVHRIYGFPFRTPALVVEKDAVFIPAGWDNEKKIAILYENLTSVRPDDQYNDVIAKPTINKTLQREVEMEADNEQNFLNKMQIALNQTPAPGQNALRPNDFPDNSKSPAVAKKQPLPGTPKKVEPGKMSASPATSEGVLANFFNSLLNKKTGAAAQGIKPNSIDKSSVRNDAAAELDRLTRQKKSGSESPTPPPPAEAGEPT